jgi:hypothetical protein
MNDYKFRSALVHGNVMQQQAHLCLVAIAGYVAIQVGPSEEDQAWYRSDKRRRMNFFQNQMIIN